MGAGVGFAIQEARPVCLRDRCRYGSHPSQGEDLSGEHNRSFALRTSLGSDYGSIASSRRAPTIIEVATATGERKFLRQFLINLDSVTWNFIRVEKSIPRFWTSFEYFSSFFRKTPTFVNPKVVARELERQLRCMGDRRSVTGSMPGGFDTKKLAKRSHLARHTQAANL